ncbi:Multidrug-efflux transporter MexB [Pantoea agglomerans]|uniref:Multidrug-efflux transporter MexB n=1 Tax=Enterobacter agglomerans TaxID=549 RepID=A0A379ACH6_ENTAG|nr:Multidrug-efflux transporter MexB [Pantoea agglomerans]
MRCVSGSIPNKLIAYSLTTEDVVSEIQSQNTQVAVGQVGGLPSVEKQALNATVKRPVDAADP